MEGDDTSTFCQDDMFCTSFSALEAMREKGELCDIRINIENHSFVAHRAILAAGIPYFQSVFTRNSGQTEVKDVTVEHLDPSALETLVRFVYSGKVNISLKNVQPLLTASRFLQLDEVHDACVEFLAKKLQIGNALQMLSLGFSLNNSNLIERSNHYIRGNFEEFSKSEGFLSLSHSCVKDIVSKDLLNAPGEEVVFEAVMNWVKNSPLDRRVHLHDLLSAVRMIFLPVDYLIKRVASEELITSSIPCRDLVEEVKTYHLLPKETSLCSRLITARRKSVDSEDIYVVCQSTNSEISVHHGGFVRGCSKFVSKKEIYCYVCHVVAANGIVYIFSLNGFWSFHVKTGEWAQLDTRNVSFFGTAVSLHGNIIYCFGCAFNPFHDKVRCFSIQQNKWLKEGRMKESHCAAAAASLGDHIYVTGGFREGYGCSNLVDKYNPLQGRWTEIPSMLTPRFYHACTTMDGKLYVCGGTRGDVYVSSAEVYDPLKNQWNYISAMKTERAYHSLLSYNNKIYVLGGRKCVHSKPLTTSEVYDPETVEWEYSFDIPTDFRFAASMSPLCDFT